MKRITTQVKSIADAHMKARSEGNFDNIVVRSKAELIEALWSGRTFSALMDEIEWRYCNINSLVLNEMSNGTYQSNSYKSNVYKGFKNLLQ
jgi:hypothetical protein